MTRLDIAIVGSGTTGQACALLLTRAGHHVVAFEREPAPGPVGAGLLLQPTGIGVLAELGCSTRPSPAARGSIRWPVAPWRA